MVYVVLMCCQETTRSLTHFVARLLRQLRKNRDDEAELMKRVPGWVTGTLFGEPVSPRVRGQFPHVHPESFFAHNHPGDMHGHLEERLYHWALTAGREDICEWTYVISS